MTHFDAVRTPAKDGGAAVASPAVIAQRIYLESPYHAIRYLKCQFSDGVLTISGRLPSFYLKQVAHKAVHHLDGVRRLDDRIEVSV